MSITDSTTSLDTAWVERRTVDFTCGTMPDLSALVTEVESKLNRGTLSSTSVPSLSDVQRWLVRGKAQLLQGKAYSFANRFAHATLSLGCYTLGLPPDFNGGKLTVADRTNDITLKAVSAHLFDLKYPDLNDESNGLVKFYSIQNMKMYFAPPAQSDIEIRLTYIRSGDDNTATDFSYIPEVERFRCCDYALFEANESLENFTAAEWYLKKWQMGVKSSNVADGRRKWKDTGYRMISIFEEGFLRGHQNHGEGT